MTMTIVCFDLEGTLVPELWVEISEQFDLPQLRKTTRDEPDEDKLMAFRLETLRENNISYSAIRRVIERVEPFDGARAFLDSLLPDMQPVIVTGSYYQFIPPLLKKLGHPLAFANFLTIENDRITGYQWRLADHKRQAVEHFKAQNFRVLAVGDSYNDIPMFEAADGGFFYNAPAAITAAYKQYPAIETYAELKKRLTA